LREGNSIGGTAVKLGILTSGGAVVEGAVIRGKGATQKKKNMGTKRGKYVVLQKAKPLSRKLETGEPMTQERNEHRVRGYRERGRVGSGQRKASVLVGKKTFIS